MVVGGSCRLINVDTGAPVTEPHFAVPSHKDSQHLPRQWYQTRGHVSGTEHSVHWLRPSLLGAASRNANISFLARFQAKPPSRLNAAMHEEFWKIHQVIKSFRSQVGSSWSGGFGEGGLSPADEIESASVISGCMGIAVTTSPPCFGSSELAPTAGISSTSGGSSGLTSPGYG